MSATFCIEMSVPLAACAVYTWKELTTLWQAVGPWHRWTTLIDTLRWPPLSTGTLVGHFGVPVESRWYRHHPDRLVERDDITMIWDTANPTARTIGATRPDICFRNKKQTLVFLLISTVLLMVTSPENMPRS